MAEHAEPVDVTESPDLLRLAEEVHWSHTSRTLRRGGEELALVIPLNTPPLVGTEASEADLASFRSAAGSWADIDTDSLKEYLRRARGEGTQRDVRQ